MLYRVALGTGFRANELRHLTVADFEIKTSQPTITVRACYSKRRREDVQPIKKPLASLLKDYLTEKPVSAPALAMPEETNVARMLKADLEAAGISSTDPERRPNVDFHALRHSYISLLAITEIFRKLWMNRLLSGIIIKQSGQ